MRCPSGKSALGGGLVESGAPAAGLFVEDGPLDGTGKVKNTKDGDRPREWFVDYQGQTAAGRTFRAFAICL